MSVNEEEVKKGLSDADRRLSAALEFERDAGRETRENQAKYIEDPDLLVSMYKPKGTGASPKRENRGFLTSDEVKESAEKVVSSPTTERSKLVFTPSEEKKEKEAVEGESKGFLTPDEERKNTRGARRSVSSPNTEGAKLVFTPSEEGEEGGVINNYKENEKSPEIETSPTKKPHSWGFGSLGRGLTYMYNNFVPNVPYFGSASTPATPEVEQQQEGKNKLR